MTATEIHLVVRYRLAPTAETERLFAALDGNRDGRLTLPTEQLAQAALLVPRARRGLTLTVDGAATATTLAETRFRVLSGGKRRGLETLLLLTAPLAPGKHRVALRIFGDLTTVEAQTTRPRLATSLPTRPGDPVVGPAKLADGTAWLEVGPTK